MHFFLTERTTFFLYFTTFAVSFPTKRCRNLQLSLMHNYATFCYTTETVYVIRSPVFGPHSPENAPYSISFFIRCFLGNIFRPPTGTLSLALARVLATSSPRSFRNPGQQRRLTTL